MKVYNHAGNLLCRKCTEEKLLSCGLKLNKAGMEAIGIEVEAKDGNQFFKPCSKCGVFLNKLRLELTVNHLNKVTPVSVMRAASNLQLSVDVEAYRADGIIYELWRTFGDAFLRKIFEAEGYEFKKKELPWESMGQ